MAAGIEITSLSYTYPDGQEALHSVNLQVAPGERVALVGPNGAGKSTLLLHLNGILNGSGKVCIGGEPVSKENLPRIRGQVGLVFQSPDDQLFSPTVFDDVAFGPIYQGLPPDEVRHRVAAALAAVGLSHYAGRASHHLSAGEKKRAAIATVLAMHPEVLALDEPTAGLDPRARRTLIDLLRTLPQTLVIATHDLALVDDLLPRMVVMDAGAIVADGPTVELLADRALLERHGLI